MPPHRPRNIEGDNDQTAAWEDAIRVVNEKAAIIQKIDLTKYEQVLTIGCGSTLLFIIICCKYYPIANRCNNNTTTCI